MTTLAEKMKALEDLDAQYKALEQEIKDEVMSLGQSQQVGRVKATFYPQGRGSWNWEKMALTLNPDEELVEKYTETKITIKWQKVVEELEETMGRNDDFREEFYTPGNPFVSVTVK